MRAAAHSVVAELGLQEAGCEMGRGLASEACECESLPGSATYYLGWLQSDAPEHFAIVAGQGLLHSMSWSALPPEGCLDFGQQVC